LTGAQLTDGAVVTSPANYEISIDAGISWHNNSDPVTLPVSGGIITGQPVTISVRLHSLAAGEFNDTIKHSSTEAFDSYVTVNGVYFAAEPTSFSTVSFGTVTGNSIVVNFTGGNGTKRVVVAKRDSVVNWIPTDGIPVYGVNNDFSQALNQMNGNKAVYDGTGNSFTLTGLASNATYYFAVYEYNTGSGNSQNYLTSSVGTGSSTTLAVAELVTDNYSLSFGNRVINKDTVIKSYTLSGNYLTGSGNITVSVPAGGYDVSLSPTSGFAQSILVPFTAGALSATSIYVRFIPTSLASYSDTLINSGGDAPTLKIPVSGKGVATLVETSSPVGFATLNGGTTGGAGGSYVVITDAATLVELMRLREGRDNSPLTVYISGTIAGYSTEISVKRTNNVTILGLGTNSGFTGFGMKVVECQNIIVRNMTFSDCHVDGKDGVEINSSSNVWVDHCSFTDSPANDPSGGSHDGELDTKVGSYNVTISYNHFMNHRKTCLLGHTPSETSDTVMTVTYYANWFDGTYSRHPRIRFAKTHLLNNLYSHAGAVGSDSGGYGVGVTCIAQVQVEGNYFENTLMPVLISGVNDPEGTLSHDPQGYIKSVNNFTVSSGAIVENLSGYSFNPLSYYTYSPLDASLVKSIVTDNAGAGILNISLPLPVEMTVFTATLKNNMAVLNWSTATETDNFGFEVEKKEAGSSFTKAGFVAGNGTSSIKHSYTFLDKLTGSEKQISYRLKQIDVDGNYKYSKEIELNNEIPTTFLLEQNYPNPFNPSTMINFSLPVDAKVVIRLYNVLGQQVGIILNKDLSAGRQQLTFSANKYSSGVYFYTIEASGKNNSVFKAVKKMMLLK
jgi:pectate lyase